MSSEVRATTGRSVVESTRKNARSRVVLLGILLPVSASLLVQAPLGAATIVNVAEVTARSSASGAPIVATSNPAMTDIAAVPMVLTKQVSPVGIAGPGDTLVYTLGFSNPSASALTNVVLVDPLDPLIDSVSSVTTGSVPDTGSGTGVIPLTGIWDPVVREVRWTIPVLGPGSRGEVQFHARLSPALTGESIVVNAFQSFSDQDPNAVTSPAVQSTVVAPALSLFLAAARERVEIGDVVGFEIRVGNSDPALDLFGTTVTLRLPDGFRYVEGTLSAAGRSIASPALAGRGRTVEAAVGDLPPGESVVLSLAATASPSAERGVLTAKATAEAVTASGTPVIAQPSSAQLRLVEGLFSSQAVIAGRVFADADGDGTWSPGDPVVPGARLFLEDGTQVITDIAGKYHIEGIRPGLHVLKLDPESVPEAMPGAASWLRASGSTGVQFVDLGAGDLFKANVGLTGGPGSLAALEILTGGPGAEPSPSEARGVLAPGAPGAGARVEEAGAASVWVAGAGVGDERSASGPDRRLPLILAAAIFEPESAELRPGAEEHLEALADLIAEIGGKGAAVRVISRPGKSAGGADSASDETLPSGDADARGLTSPGRAGRLIGGVAQGEGEVLGERRARVMEGVVAASLDPGRAGPAAGSPSAAAPPGTTTALSGARGSGAPVMTAGSTPPAQQPPAADPALGAGAQADPAEAILKALPHGLHLLRPRDGDLVTVERLDIDVAFPTGHGMRLAVNGEVVPEDRIGLRMETSLSGMSLRRYIGVALRPGSNMIEARSSPAAGPTLVMEIHVDRAGAPSLLVVRGIGGSSRADGRSPGRAAVQVLDARGHAVADGTMVTLTAERGAILGRDADPVAEGFQSATTGGIAAVRLSPATEAESRLVTARSGEAMGEAEVRFEPELRKWILAGVGEAGWSANGNALHADDLARDLSAGDDAGARMALFARGRIGEKDLVSIAWDTDRERDEDVLFRVEDPMRPFPVYGDSSAQAHTVESQGKLALRWERERSMAAWGDFHTGLTAAELARYERPLSGLLTHFESPRWTLDSFGASTPQTQRTDEIPADGSSGPYRLSRSGVVAYSERVSVQVRDRLHTERVLAESPQSRFNDYDIDYGAGTILFRSPVASHDAGFNIVTIVVSYEVADASGSNLVAGGRLGYRAGARLEIGGSAVHEDREGEDFLLTGADLTLRPWSGASVRAEYAGTSDASGNAGAWAVRLHSPLGPNAGLGAYVRSVPEDYANPSLSGASEIGSRKSGLELRASLPDGSRLVGEAFRQEQAVLSTSRSSAALGWERPAGAITWDLGGRGVQGPEEASGENIGSALAKAGLRARLSPRLDGSLQREEIVSGGTVTGYPTRTTLGAGYRFNDHARGFLRHETDESDVTDQARTLLGVEGSLGEHTTVESRYALEDALSGERGYATLGVRARLPLSDVWTADLRAERSQTMTGVSTPDFTSFTAGAEYLPGGSKMTGRYEARFGEADERHLLTTAGAVRVSADFVLFARNQLNLIRPDLADSRLDADGLLGLAYRPLGADRLNWLGRIEATRGAALPGGGTSLATAPAARTYLGVFEANYEPAARWHLLGRYAGRYARDEAPASSIRAWTEVWEAGTMFDVGRRMTAGLSGRLLRQPSTGTEATGVGVESGLMVARDLWLVAGYNVTGFSDEQFPDGNQRSRGPFISLRFKFDESLIGGLTGSPAKEAQPDSAGLGASARPEGSSGATSGSGP